MLACIRWGVDFLYASSILWFMHVANVVQYYHYHSSFPTQNFTQGKKWKAARRGSQIMSLLLHRGIAPI